MVMKILIFKFNLEHHDEYILYSFLDLFIYREHKPSSDGGVGYPRVDWFDHDTPRDEQEEQGKRFVDLTY